MRERVITRIVLGLAAGGVALSLSACSIYMPISPLSSNDDDITGSIATPASQRNASPLSPKLNEEDWRRAQSAMILAVDPQGNGAPVAWDNPESGTKGSFVANGQLFVADSRVCRPFMATLNKPAPDTMIQGTSCRLGPNEWVVREANPVKDGPSVAKAE